MSDLEIVPIIRKTIWTNSRWEDWENVKREKGAYLNKKDINSFHFDLLPKMFGVDSVGYSFEILSMVLKANWMIYLEELQDAFDSFRKDVSNTLGTNSNSYSSSDNTEFLAAIYHEIYHRHLSISNATNTPADYYDAHKLNIMLLSIFCSIEDDMEQSVPALVSVVNDLGVHEAIRLSVSGIPPVIMRNAIIHDIDHEIVKSIGG